MIRFAEAGTVQRVTVTLSGS
eukprot:SAG22_NODE_11171_length_497_cov_0.899497_1_plen_20_part_10